MARIAPQSAATSAPQAAGQPAVAVPTSEGKTPEVAPRQPVSDTAPPPPAQAGHASATIDSSVPAAVPDRAPTGSTVTASTAQVPQTDPRVRAAFLDHFLAYDGSHQQVVMGKARRLVPRDDFYRLLDRPDLLEQSEAASRRRLYLAIAGGAVAVVGATVGIVELAGMPDLDSLECTSDPTRFNNVCEPEANRRELIAVVALAGGLGVGALLGTLAYWSSPDVTSPDETRALIAHHNAELMRRLRGGSSALRLTPFVATGAGGVVAALRF